MSEAQTFDPDAAVFDRVRQRDPSALDELYERYGRLAFALAYRIVHSPETAEDVVQDAFLTVWRRADRFQPERGLVRAWLLTLVRNRAIDVLRALDSRPKVVATLDDVGSLAALTDDPSDVALRNADAARVRQAMQSLPPEQRKAVELAFFAGLSYPEVAERTGAPLGTVKSRMRLAMERLRHTLAAGNGRG